MPAMLTTMRFDLPIAKPVLVLRSERPLGVLDEDGNPPTADCLGDFATEEEAAAFIAFYLANPPAPAGKY